MHRQKQNVFLVADPQQLDPQQWTTGEVKRCLDLFSRRTLRLRLALFRGKPGEVFDRHSQMQTRRDDLRRFSVLTRERRSQGLVTSDDLVETLFERCHVEVPGETHRGRQIVESAARLQLVEKP